MPIEMRQCVTVTPSFFVEGITQQPHLQRRTGWVGHSVAIWSFLDGPGRGSSRRGDLLAR